ncbi:hypothetical protein JKP88DRAFT_178689 [Tribonema minus]|uniref:Uncharacterized protein n=1 Tax=Tribonema minus TaxID=303371 RepID=A0A836CJL2_9STRA|nr:hypothetical protein JKP88DRAFT_178689 [Tribonema minus]
MVFVYAVLQATRVFMASKGNKTETLEPLAASALLAAPVALLYAYALALQTYVLQLDVVLAAIGLVFVGLETLLSATTAVAFYNAFRG